MSLSSIQLDAFLQVANQCSFSKAAKVLHITQPALSQRILNLEEELNVTLFYRVGNAVTLTEAGVCLRKYCLEKASLESDAVLAIRNCHEQLSGHISIAGFSTMLRSLLLPEIARLAREWPAAHFSLAAYELRDIEKSLFDGRATLAFTLEVPLSNDVFYELIGEETYVMIQSAFCVTRENVLIDHDEFDRTTANFFNRQTSKCLPYQRIYFDEIYSIMDAVREGLGRAVVPQHLLRNRTDLMIDPHFEPMPAAVFFCHLKRKYRPRLEQELIKKFKDWRPF